MFQYYLAIKSISSIILVRSSNKKAIDSLKSSDFLKRYIPNIEILPNKQKFDCQLIIKTGKPRINLKYPRAVYSNDCFNEKDIVSLIELLLERSRQEHGFYCIHASACSFNGQAVIFWGGASGMGKTTLCQKMQENCGAIWFADEKVVIDFSTGRVVGCVGTVYLKNKRQFKTISQKLIKPLPIGFFVYPLLCSDSDQTLCFDKWPKSKFLWHLFEESNRKIRATSRLFFSETEPILSLDTLALARKRLADLKKTISFYDCYYIRGNYKDICEKISFLNR